MGWVVMVVEMEIETPCGLARHGPNAGHAVFCFFLSYPILSYSIPSYPIVSYSVY